MKIKSTIARSLMLAPIVAGIVTPAQAAVLPIVTSPVVLAAVAIPGLGITVGTKTILGWALGLGIGYAGYRAIAASTKSNSERDSEKRGEEIKWAWIAFASAIGVVSVLSAMGLISFTEVTSAMNAV